MLLLVGNKSDLKQRCVSAEEGRKLAEAEGMFFIETSAKDATNVEQAFCIVTSQLMRGHKAGVVASLKQRRKRASMLVDGVEVGVEDEKHPTQSSNCAC